MRISWDDTSRFYSQGVSHGVLYPKNSPGVAWSGLVSVTEKGDGSSTTLYVDGQRYFNSNSLDSFAGTIQALTYPDAFEPYNGVAGGITSQARIPFGFSWQNNREIHILYNVLAAPSKNQYQSAGEQINLVAFSWDLTTVPVAIPGARPSAHLVIALDYAHPAAISALEDVLYGDDANGASLPSALAVFNLFDTYATLRIVDNGDGTWTATGPDDLVTISGDVFTINSTTAEFIDADTYRISSF